MISFEYISLPLSVSLSLSGVQVDEDLQSIEAGPPLDRTEVAGSHTSGESLLLFFMSDVTFDFLTRGENNKNNRINFCFSSWHFGPSTFVQTQQMKVDGLWADVGSEGLSWCHTHI